MQHATYYTHLLTNRVNNLTAYIFPLSISHSIGKTPDFRVCGSTGTDNPFKGTWTGQITVPGGETGPQNATFTITFADTTFEDAVTFATGAMMKQKGTYTYTASTVTTETTAVDYIFDGESATGGWVSSGEFFETYGNNLTGTLSNGKLIFDGLGELTKTN